MLIWLGFLVFIFLLLALDLGVFNREAHVISAAEALGWTTLWVSISLLFSIVVFFAYRQGWVASDLDGQKAVMDYLSGYLVELSLSMDNIFVIAIIFRYFQVPDQNQHRVLFWGILGAIVFRGLMIGLGIILLSQFSWMTYVFGLFLLYAAIRMIRSDQEIDPERNPVIQWVRKLIPVTKEYEGSRFFVRKRHVLAATPLFVALMVVEVTDIMFAFDSIPAIFAITTEPFLVFSSNIFAILGLRSMYFLLAAALNRFVYIKYSLIAILFYVAAKILLHQWVHLPQWVSLLVILLLLGGGIGFSLLFGGRNGLKTE